MSSDQPSQAPITLLVQTLQELLVKQSSKDDRQTDAKKLLGRPPIYSGKSNESLPAWIFKITRAIYAHKLTEADRLLHVAEFLEGGALAWFQHLVEEIEDGHHLPIDTWNEFLTALRQKFESPTLQQDARTALRNLRQTRGL